MRAFERIWLERKCGRKMGAGYVMSSYLPLLVILLITAALVFSIIFIFSVSTRIDRMLEVLGSGSVFSYADVPPDLLPDGTECHRTASSEALLYASGGERAVMIKGVEDGYFDGMRGEELGVGGLPDDLLNPLLISSSLAEELGLSPGGRLTILLYEAEKGRTRPYLATVAAVFDSVYPQLDSRLVFSDLSLFSSHDGVEILLPADSDADALVRMLSDAGVPAFSYKELNRHAYDNVESSIDVLYLIFALVAVLASFFSSDAAEGYVERDRKDIAELMVLGVDRRRLLWLYEALTLIHVFVSLLAGTLLGIMLALLSPYAIEAIAAAEPAFLDYYVRSFSIVIPVFRIAAMMMLSLAVSALSAYLSLCRVTVANVLGSW